MQPPRVPNAGERITEAWGNDVAACLRSLIPMQSNTIRSTRTPSGTTYEVIGRAAARRAVVAGQDFDFGSIEQDANDTSTYNIMGGWLLTPAGPRKIGERNADGQLISGTISKTDFTGGSASAPRIVYLQLTPPGMSPGDAVILVKSESAFNALAGDKLCVPLAEIGVEGEGDDAVQVVYRYCRPVCAVAYNAPEDAP